MLLVPSRPLVNMQANRPNRETRSPHPVFHLINLTRPACRKDPVTKVPHNKINPARNPVVIDIRRLLDNCPFLAPRIRLGKRRMLVELRWFLLVMIQLGLKMVRLQVLLWIVIEYLLVLFLLPLLLITSRGSLLVTSVY
jgi:hypothetical protein